MSVFDRTYILNNDNTAIIRSGYAAQLVQAVSADNEADVAKAIGRCADLAVAAGSKSFEADLTRARELVEAVHTTECDGGRAARALESAKMGYGKHLKARLALMVEAIEVGADTFPALESLIDSVAELLPDTDATDPDGEALRGKIADCETANTTVNRAQAKIDGSVPTKTYGHIVGHLRAAYAEGGNAKPSGGGKAKRSGGR